MTQSPSKRLVTEADFADPTSAAGGVLAATFVGRAMKQPANATRVTPLTVEPLSSTAGRAKFELSSSNAEFASVKDPTMFFGYNAEVATGGGRAGEPMFAWGNEGFYRATNWAGSGVQQDTMEWYLEYRNANRSIVDFRPYAVTIGRDDNAARWGTTQIEIGTDASTAKSQFFVKGKPITLGLNTTDNIFRVDNDRIVSNLQHSHNGAPVNLVTFPDGKNAHLFFIQDDGAGNQTTPWYLANFGGDPNHYLWDQAHSRMHSEYVGAGSDSTAMSRFHSQVEALGGFITKSPDGTRYRITVANGGALSAVPA